MTNLSDDVETLEMIAVVKAKPEKGFLLKKTTISTVLGPNEVLVKVLSISNKTLNTIFKESLLSLENPFNIELNKNMLD